MKFNLFGGFTGFCVTKAAKQTQSVIAEGPNEANQVRQASLVGIGCLESPAAGICLFLNEKKFQPYRMTYSISSNLTYKIERIGNTFPKHTESYIVFPSQLAMDPTQNVQFDTISQRSPRKSSLLDPAEKWNIDISSPRKELL